MYKVANLPDIERKIKEVEVKIENSSDSKMKKKLEKELEFLKDLQMFVRG